MMSGSSSETVSLLSKTFNRSDVSPESLTNLRHALHLFVEKHSDPDETPSVKVLEELRKLHHDHVETDPNKVEAFVLALTTLEPYLRALGDLQAWFEVVLVSVVETQGTRKSVIKQTQDFLLGCIVYDKEGTDTTERSHSCQKLTSRLVAEYLDRTEALCKGKTGVTLPPQNRSQQQLVDVVVAVGRQHPKELFSALASHLLTPTTRYHTLQLMAAWLGHQHPHLDVIAQTSVIEILLKCLMNDRSTVMISVALQCLLMLLPHIPATVALSLPRLFLIYSRCLCWEKFSASSSKAQRDLVTDDRVRTDEDEDDEDVLFSIDPGWQVVTSVPDAPEAPAPELLSYFTYLYGLYPLNFMSYVRKPRKYLKQIDFPGAEDFDLDQAVIRSRTEQFQRAHLLHPSFFNMTAEEELAENRWLKAEPSEVVAECLGLYCAVESSTDLKNPPSADKTIPTLPTSPVATMAALPISPDRVQSPTSELNLNSPVTSPSLMEASIDSLTAKTLHSSSSDTIYLQRELMVLRSELNFERHLKRQHVAAIGQLKRDRIRAVNVEAETATLINANRTLLKKLNDVTSFNEKLQKETQSRKMHARQSEDMLNAKIRGLRGSLGDQKALETKLSKAEGDIEILRQLVVESERRELVAREKVECVEQERKRIVELEKEVEGMREEVKRLKGGEGQLDGVDEKRDFDELERKYRRLLAFSRSAKGEDEGAYSWRSDGVGANGDTTAGSSSRPIAVNGRTPRHAELNHRVKDREHGLFSRSEGSVDYRNGYTLAAREWEGKTAEKVAVPETKESK